MEVDVAVEEPRAGVVRIEADRDVVARRARVREDVAHEIDLAAHRRARSVAVGAVGEVVEGGEVVIRRGVGV